MSTRPQPCNAVTENIPITEPVLDDAETQAIQRVLQSGWLVQGPRVAKFEYMFKDFVGVKHAMATTSCTAALHLALLAAGIGPGDEVLLPSFTFVATANAVEYTGAKPVFIDIDLDTFTIDTGKIAEYLHHRSPVNAPGPRCILPVSLFGLCADMQTINEIASYYGLLVIEDAACGLGAKRAGWPAGTEALAGCFSFHPRKVVTTGEGGMVVTNEDNLAAVIKKIRDHGAATSDFKRHIHDGGSLLPDYDVLGYNYRLTDLQGALGIVQMQKADLILSRRQKAADQYHKLLQGIDDIKIPLAPAGYNHAYQSYVCLYKINEKNYVKGNDIAWDRIDQWNKERNYLMAMMERNNIAVRQGTHAVHMLGYYKKKYGYNIHDYPMSYIADRLSISLPLYANITEREQERVVDCLK